MPVFTNDLNPDTAFEIANGELYLYFLTKESVWYKCEIIGTKMLNRPTSSQWDEAKRKWNYSYTKTLFYKAKFNLNNGDKPRERRTFANGSVLEIYDFIKIGNNIPDTETYWYATLDGKVIDWSSRPDCWRSNDHIYDNWVAKLVNQHSPVELPKYA